MREKIDTPLLVCSKKNPNFHCETTLFDVAWALKMRAVIETALSKSNWRMCDWKKKERNAKTEWETNYQHYSDIDPI